MNDEQELETGKAEHERKQAVAEKITAMLAGETWSSARQVLALAARVIDNESKFRADTVR